MERPSAAREKSMLELWLDAVARELTIGPEVT